MLTFNTDKRAYRYCSTCRSPMTIFKETDEILSAACPKRGGGKDEVHETILSWKSERALVEYVREVFAPAMNAGSD